MDKILDSVYVLDLNFKRHLKSVPHERILRKICLFFLAGMKFGIWNLLAECKIFDSRVSANGSCLGRIHVVPATNPLPDQYTEAYNIVNFWSSHN